MQIIEKWYLKYQLRESTGFVNKFVHVTAKISVIYL